MKKARAAIAGLLLSAAVASVTAATARPLRARTGNEPDTTRRIVCYFPENCYRLVEPTPAPPTLRHPALAGRVFVGFVVDSLLRKRDFTIACARLTWRETGEKYAPDCQQLTAAQQQELLALVVPLLKSLRFVPARADRRGCGQERWTMSVTFR